LAVELRLRLSARVTAPFAALDPPPHSCALQIASPPLRARVDLLPLTDLLVPRVALVGIGQSLSGFPANVPGRALFQRRGGTAPPMHRWVGMGVNREEVPQWP
jgi:hypothetical protein